MRDLDENGITDAVIERVSRTPDPRFRKISAALVRHLHDFVREVELTEAEWDEAIRFLTETGQKCDDRRQEYILLSDALGVSMLVDAINHRHPGDSTETTVFGPFFVASAPEVDSGADISGSLDGEPLLIVGTIHDDAGVPIAGATVDAWHSDQDGFYDVQYDGGGLGGRGRVRTDGEGRFHLWTILPRHYPIPTDGPVGRMIAAQDRHPFRPAHVHFMVAAPGHAKLVTHLFLEGSEYLDSDVVFGVKDSLVRPVERCPAGATEAGGTAPEPYWLLRANLRLLPARATATA